MNNNMNMNMNFFNQNNNLFKQQNNNGFNQPINNTVKPQTQTNQFQDLNKNFAQPGTVDYFLKNGIKPSVSTFTNVNFLIKIG